jgi:hypothetical protein
MWTSVWRAKCKAFKKKTQDFMLGEAKRKEFHRKTKDFMLGHSA